MIEKGEIYMGFFSAIKDRMSSEEYDMGACILCGKELYGKRIVATQKFFETINKTSEKNNQGFIVWLAKHENVV